MNYICIQVGLSRATLDSQVKVSHFYLTGLPSKSIQWVNNSILLKSNIWVPKHFRCHKMLGATKLLGPTNIESWKFVTSKKNWDQKIQKCLVSNMSKIWFLNSLPSSAPALQLSRVEIDLISQLTGTAIHPPRIVDLLFFSCSTSLELLHLKHFTSTTSNVLLYFN